MHKWEGKSLIINRGKMGPALWGQDSGNLTLAPNYHFQSILEIFVMSAYHLFLNLLKKICLT